jgi:folate-dependent phosphoribosylglycinamide formyltransferase PurN
MSKVDAGGIVVQKKCAVAAGETADSLKAKVRKKRIEANNPSS